jgi:hypothetical protein
LPAPLNAKPKAETGAQTLIMTRQPYKR